MVYKGFRFGMLLQIAIGPVCLLILQAAIASGFGTAESGVAAVVLVDAAFISAAILGIGSVFNRFPKSKSFLKYFGALVLILFGLNNILGVMGISLLPGSSSAGLSGERSFFLTMLLLTMSNPLTILFWAGVFSTKLAQEAYTQPQIFAFGAGAALSTAFFLSAVAFLGSLVNARLNNALISGLNLVVGLVLIFFGLRLIQKKE
jgi:threonine/homoserine/homoserine lactone efflux protein